MTAFRKHLPHAHTPKQTRRSLSVRKRHRKQDRPLPFDLQILPPYLRKLPLHPCCGTDVSSWGKQMRLKEYSDNQLLKGVGLSLVRTDYEVQVKGKRVGYTEDPQFGLAFVREAQDRGMDAKMYRIP